MMTPHFTFDPDFLPASADIFAALDRDLDWVQREAPRKEYWTNTLGRPYTYGHGLGQRTYEPQPSHYLIDNIARSLDMALRFRYEGCFLNRYKDERDSLGWHADDDPGIDHTRPIAVVTLGAARDIMVRTVGDPGSQTRINLTPGSLFLMGAGMQQTHQHRIPKSAFKCGPRISLTFRKLLP